MCCVKHNYTVFSFVGLWISNCHSNSNCFLEDFFMHLVINFQNDVIFLYHFKGKLKAVMRLSDIVAGREKDKISFENTSKIKSMENCKVCKDLFSAWYCCILLWIITVETECCNKEVKET